MTVGSSGDRASAPGAARSPMCLFFSSILFILLLFYNFFYGNVGALPFRRSCVSVSACGYAVRIFFCFYILNRGWGVALTLVMFALPPTPTPSFIEIMSGRACVYEAGHSDDFGAEWRRDIFSPSRSQAGAQVVRYLRNLTRSYYYRRHNRSQIFRSLWLCQPYNWVSRAPEKRN